MKQLKSFGFLILFGVLWWGLMYPELCMVEGTYEIAAATAQKVSQEDCGEEKEENAFEDFRVMLEEGPEKIRFKMKIAGRLSQ